MLAQGTRGFNHIIQLKSGVPADLARGLPMAPTLESQPSLPLLLHEQSGLQNLVPFFKVLSLETGCTSGTLLLARRARVAGDAVTVTAEIGSGSQEPAAVGLDEVEDEVVALFPRRAVGDCLVEGVAIHEDGPVDDVVVIVIEGEAEVSSLA